VVADPGGSALLAADSKFSKRRSNTIAAFVYIHDRQLLQRVASCTLEIARSRRIDTKNDSPWLDRKIHSPRGETRDNKRKIGIGITRARNITTFIASPGMTSGRSASNPASPWRTTCAAVT
jgi:hypothetical protein